jgi:hypothetical protein
MSKSKPRLVFARALPPAKYAREVDVPASLRGYEISSQLRQKIATRLQGKALSMGHWYAENKDWVPKTTDYVCGRVLSATVSPKDGNAVYALCEVFNTPKGEAVGKAIDDKRLKDVSITTKILANNDIEVLELSLVSDGLREGTHIIC